MGFISIQFILFIACAFCLAWLTRGSLKKVVFLLFNFFFLASFSRPIHWIMMAILICITYLCVWSIEKSKSKVVLTIGISSVVIILAIFKYAGAFGFKNIMMPLGLSFTTFKAISCMVDCFKGKMKIPSFLDLAVYLSFFPCVSAGPIHRAKRFIKQLNTNTPFDYKQCKNGAVLAALGMFQKMVFADFLNNIIYAIDHSEKQLTGSYTILSIILYSIYIYIDFDAYSNMVIGISNMLGFNIPRNFARPYLASSIKEFWNRWHISLSSWLRDYIYIPLGGSRKGKMQKYMYITIVFLVSGFWHGSTIVFIIWGLGHALLQIFEDTVAKDFFNSKNKSFFTKILGIIFNFIVVSLLWVFFGADSVADAMMTFGNLLKPMKLDFSVLDISNAESIWLLVVLITIFIFDILREKRNMIDWLSNRNFVVRWLVYASLIVIVIIFGVYGPGYNAGDFIYVTF